ncbi:helix-turn-helix domain-containing protein [Sphingomonas floccifaciens]|uniref:Helix-turn-helix domain-containing protein n=2 Tax=Sphingomonas floccifaciens TaxID=1844115 RepID=A0ABW4NKR6_9SPHN
MSGRMRLPEGFVELRADLGNILRDRRKSENIPLKNLAADVGITRESLSRIERGRRCPGYDTLYRIMGQLGLEWHQIAIRGRAERPARHFPRNEREENLEDLGAMLRKGRKAAGLSLRALAAECALSYSRLSRIERGQSRYSDVLEEDPDDAMLDPDRRRLRFSHPRLAGLAERGRLRP